MPRDKRLNIAGAIYHVITRGLERKEIFRDEKDKEEFIARLEKAIKETGCQCYAWSLMSNHVHLLIRTRQESLTDLMRRVLTGYAIYFNRRYKRRGYLYQGRYKSILCQEDVYLLELVRYIHLNPVRAGIVGTVEELGKYRWTGHSVLVGKRKREWQEVKEVLMMYGKRENEARKKYKAYVRDGVGKGDREDLMGGGLRRSAGGWVGVKKLRRMGERWIGDERILGDGDFVDRVLKESEEEMARKEELKRKGWNIEKLIKEVCKKKNVREEELMKRGRENKVSMAKGLIAYWGREELGITGRTIARRLKISDPAVVKAAKKGETHVKDTGIKLIS